MPSISSRRFAFGLVVFIAAYTAASLALGRSPFLNGLGNFGQSLILAVAAFTAFLNIRTGRGSKPFWALTSLGFFLWFVSQLLWTYYESILRVQVPNAYSGDVLFFLHMVPLIDRKSTRLNSSHLGISYA